MARLSFSRELAVRRRSLEEPAFRRPFSGGFATAAEAPALTVNRLPLSRGLAGELLAHPAEAPVRRPFSRGLTPARRLCRAAARFRPRRPAFAAACLAGVLALAGCAPADPAPASSGGSGPAAAAVIGLTYIPNIQFAPFYVVDADGGLPAGVTLRHHGSSEGLFTALASGEEQFIVAGGDEILQARSQAVDVVAVAAYYRRYPVRLIVLADSPIQSAADLEGHSVGLPGPYGENWFALVIAMKAAGLTDAEVTVKSIGYTQQAALVSGQVDAVVGFSNGDATAFAASGIPVRAIDLDVPLVSICLATTGAYAAAHPETVKATVAALRAGLAATVADPRHALDVAGRYIPDFTDADARASAERVLAATTELFVDDAGSVDGPLDPAQWEKMAAAMLDAGLVDPVDAAAALTNAYAVP
ncbi:MAG: ABC transporter substrate-binding protein [Propionibacteriaceae bacterium]|nr:ABC transporter substrate-binding protein [Propionibacteriaceae bacterium]